MLDTIRPVRRNRITAGVGSLIAVTAVLAGAAACGSVSAEDQPAAPAQQLHGPHTYHGPLSANSAENPNADGNSDWLYVGPHGKPIPRP